MSASNFDFGDAADVDDNDLESYMDNMSMTRTAFRRNGGVSGYHWKGRLHLWLKQQAPGLGPEQVRPA
jgi:hypothetical protein